jgi:hypothetical protein
MNRGTVSVFGRLAVACCLGALSLHAIAQKPFTPPEALIIVQPMGDHAIITLSYSGKVNHSTVRQAMEKLASIGRWTLTAPEVSDVDLRTSAQYGPPAALGVQTGATANISGGPLAASGGFILQPFVEAFRGLSSYKLLYWVGPQRGFQGLRSFDSPSVTVYLTQEGGPYRYTITNHTNQGPAPALPLTQARISTVAAVTPASPSPVNSAWRLVGPVIAIAIGSGLFVFLLLRLFSRARYKSRNAGPRNRTSSKNSGITSRV